MSIDIEEVNNYDSELDTVIDSLIAYLSDKDRLGKDIDGFYNDWSEGNNDEQERRLVCQTVSVNHTYTQPKLLSKQDVTGVNPAATAVRYRVGQYEIDLQLDIWTSYKAQRNHLYKKLYDIFNEDFLTKDNYASGLSLTLANYFDVIARYDIVGYNFLDDQRSSLDDEWRVKVDIRVHFDKIQEKAQYKILETILVTEEDDAQNGQSI